MSETVQLIPHQDSPRCIRLHEADNVAVVVNDGGVFVISVDGVLLVKRL